MNIKNRWINYQEKIFLDLAFINSVKKKKFHIKSSFQENI